MAKARRKATRKVDTHKPEIIHVFSRVRQVPGDDPTNWLFLWSGGVWLDNNAERIDMTGREMDELILAGHFEEEPLPIDI